MPRAHGDNSVPLDPMLVLFYYVGMRQFFFGVPEILVDLIRDPVDPRSLSKKLRSPGSRPSGSPVIRSAARTEAACPLQSSLGWIIGVMICRSLTLASVPGVASGKCESLKAKGFFELVRHWCSDGPLLGPTVHGATTCKLLGDNLSPGLARLVPSALAARSLGMLPCHES